MIVQARAWCVVAALASAAAIAAPAPANLVEEERQAGEVAMPLAPGSEGISFNQFDDLGGGRELLSVTLQVDGAIGAAVTAENDSPLPAPDFALSITGFMTVDFDRLSTFLTFERVEETDGSITGSDGVPGSGTDFWDFGFVGDEDSATAEATADLASFIGAGTIVADVFASGGFSISGTTDSTMIIADFIGDATIDIVYRYRVIPAPGVLALLGLAGLAGRPRRRGG